MKAFVTDCGGSVRQLPTLLQWNIKRTDGDPCDSFSVQFPLSGGWEPILQRAVGFRGEWNGKTVFTGVVDDFELSLSHRGLLAELTGRGMAALLLDNQVRAAEYAGAQLQDILNRYVKPYGISGIQAETMPTVPRFVVETGYTCWQVLAGFCRHSAGIYPRFDENGTLILRKNSIGTARRFETGGCLSAQLIRDRYGAAAKQILVNTRTGEQHTAENSEFIRIGGKTVHVAGIAGNKIRAAWRNAEQRVEDSWRDSSILKLTVPECFAAAPGDRAEVRLPELGINGIFTVREAESLCDSTGRTCTVSLR